MDHYIQDSLGLRVNDEYIPSIIPTVRTPTSPRAPKRRLVDARSHGIPEKKQCRDCNQVKPSVEFNRSTSNRDGLFHYCKSCSRARSRQQYAKLEHKAQRVQMAWERRIQQIYGLTPEEYTERSVAQGNRCPICGSAPSRLVIDHDHETGAIRGLLCKQCNIALGYMRDTPAFLRAAADYLEQHGK